MARQTLLLCRECRDGDAPADRPQRRSPDTADFESLLPGRPKLLGALGEGIGDGLGDGFGGGVRAHCQGCGAYKRLRLVRH